MFNWRSSTLLLPRGTFISGESLVCVETNRYENLLKGYLLVWFFAVKLVSFGYILHDCLGFFYYSSHVSFLFIPIIVICPVEYIDKKVLVIFMSNSIFVTVFIFSFEYVYAYRTYTPRYY